MLQLAHRLLLFSWLFWTRAGPEPIEPQEGGERQEKNEKKTLAFALSSPVGCCDPV